MKLSQIILEFLGAKEYQAPDDAKTLMADFYTVQILQQPDVHYPSHLRDEQEYELKQIERTLLPRLRDHLLKAAGYSIASEMRHFLDHRCRVDGTAQKQFDLKYDILQDRLRPGLAHSLLTWGSFDRDDNLNDYRSLALVGLEAFSGEIDGYQLTWVVDYGGKPWAEACQAWLKLYQAQTSTDITLAADRLYDLEHNSGQLLDKNEEYQGEWVAKMLDFKFAYKNPEPMFPFASPLLKKLAQSYMRYFKKHPDTKDQLEPLRQALEQVGININQYGLGYSITSLHGNGARPEILCNLVLLPHGLIKLEPHAVRLNTKGGERIVAQKFAVTDLDGIVDYAKEVEHALLQHLGRHPSTSNETSKSHVDQSGYSGGDYSGVADNQEWDKPVDKWSSRRIQF